MGPVFVMPNLHKSYMYYGMAGQKVVSLMFPYELREKWDDIQENIIDKLGLLDLNELKQKKGKIHGVLKRSNSSQHFEK